MASKGFGTHYEEKNVSRSYWSDNEKGAASSMGKVFGGYAEEVAKKEGKYKSINMEDGGDVLGFPRR